MKEFSIESLAEIIQAGPTNNIEGFFTGVSTDSRTAQPGDCFFALSGENFDGHDFVGDAFAKGAVCAVVGRDFEDAKLAGRSLLIVPDTIKALGDFAGQYRRRMNFKVVAITGSAGKTTTKQIVYHVLNRHFHVSAAPKSFNNNIGLPLTLLGAEPEDEIVVAEIGTNHPGEIAYLTRIALPDIAVITNVYPAHLDGFVNLQAIVQEKLSISEGLGPDGILIVNADFDQLISACRAKDMKFITFGQSDTSDIQARNIAGSGFGSSFTVDGSEVYLPLPGRGNVENALAAWAVCSRFGLTVDDFAAAVRTLPAIPMRTELLQIGTLTVLNDCYNANPASMKNALDILADIGSAKRRRTVFICGDMAELGEQSRQLHAELGCQIARAKVDLLLAVGEFAQITAESAKRNAGHNLQTKCFKDAASVNNKLEGFIKDYDIILVKGSRVARLETVIERLKELFLVKQGA
ncbi:MAG TPA: UDP-N-acetylmuramoyl-tripeptide--D-alanyl-D-alanine ligase [Sedimentisphaerales bacterium]|nr:UDP-N-acetylmuramoyl-tripeptide--D-alanyl-D-alanine ligase [Sedimentisphaerales bacterium]